MVRAAVPGWRIAMPGMNHLDLHFFGTGHSCIEIVEFKPQQHAVSMRQILVTDCTVIVSHVPAVQLQDQSPIRNKALVLWPAVCALTAEHTLIPATACFDVTHANQWLWAHWNSVVNSITDVEAAPHWRILRDANVSSLNWLVASMFPSAVSQALRDLFHVYTAIRCALDTVRFQRKVEGFLDGPNSFVLVRR
jgi:hypothetical protein